MHYTFVRTTIRNALMLALSWTAWASSVCHGETAQSYICLGRRKVEGGRRGVVSIRDAWRQRYLRTWLGRVTVTHWPCGRKWRWSFTSDAIKSHSWSFFVLIASALPPPLHGEHKNLMVSLIPVLKWRPPIMMVLLANQIADVISKGLDKLKRRHWGC